MIATPIMDGKPDDTYNVSIHNTVPALREAGAKVDLMKLKYMADIYFSRIKLFGEFVRKKQYTHMLFLDADMGWQPQTVANMLLLNREFIAAVGVKKKYPLEFAFSMMGDDGKDMPFYYEPETMVGTVAAVGAAFMMISRSCAEKMVEAYPEMQFDYENDVEYAVFDPIIINNGNNTPRRRLSEDYSFCYRWRQLGGKVEILMDATLTHTGNHTFTGNMFEEWAKTDPSVKLETTHGEKA
jgi:hypothetical protein